MFLKSILLIAPLIIFTIPANAQNGCTDPTATNYNAAATYNDGSCTYAPTHYNPLIKTVLATGVSESSGLIFTGGKLWTHNDSGNPPCIFSIDTTTGAVLQTIIIDNYPNTDWEDITADSNYLYVGDFGNNNGDRTDLKVLKIAKVDITNADTVHLNAQAISFSYTDQTSFIPSSTHNFDCEAMVSIGDSLYLFTKDRGDLMTRVYKLGKVPGTYAIAPYTSYNVNGLITGAAYNAATKEIVLVGYFLTLDSKAFLWFLYDYHGDSFFSGNKRRVEISNGGPWQTEGISYTPYNTFMLSCESFGLTPAALYFGATNIGQHLSINTTDKGTTYPIYPNPTNGLIHLNGVKQSTAYKAYDATGRLIQTGTVTVHNAVIDLTALNAGEYMIMLDDQKNKPTILKTFKY